MAVSDPEDVDFRPSTVIGLSLEKAADPTEVVPTLDRDQNMILAWCFQGAVPKQGQAPDLKGVL